MPAYSNATPPLSLFPGDVGFSFSAEAFPADGTAGSQFAIPEPAGFPDQGRTVRWQTIFGTNPSAVNIRLQGAIADVDTEFTDLDTSRHRLPMVGVIGALDQQHIEIGRVNDDEDGNGLLVAQKAGPSASPRDDKLR